MSLLEQQPNASNLQTLEAELALTKQEMEEFRRLPKEERERQKEERLAKLLDLQTRLDEAIQKAIKTGEFDEAKKLKNQLEREIRDLEDMVNVIEESVPTQKDEKIFREIEGGDPSRYHELEHLTPQIAELLIKSKAALIFNHLVTISDEVAGILSAFPNGLSFKRLVSISDTTAEFLADSHGSLWLNGLTTLSDRAAKALAKKTTNTIYLMGLLTISDKAIASLFKIRDRLHITNPGIIERINSFKKPQP